jgi:hypothetical protein
MSSIGADGISGYSDIPLADQIVMHLDQCWQCQRAIATDKPKGLGQKSGHCEVYWHLQLMWAKTEGMVNNIVAHTEYGDEAETRGRLE